MAAGAIPSFGSSQSAIKLENVCFTQEIYACRVPSDWSVPFDDAKIEEKELAGAEPCHDAVMGL